MFAMIEENPSVRGSLFLVRRFERMYKQVVLVRFTPSGAMFYPRTLVSPRRTPMSSAQVVRGPTDIEAFMFGVSKC